VLSEGMWPGDDHREANRHAPCGAAGVDPHAGAPQRREPLASVRDGGSSVNAAAWTRRARLTRSMPPRPVPRGCPRPCSLDVRRHHTSAETRMRR
jgi:hypothetical protein